MEISFSLFILTPTLPNLPSSYIDMIMTLCRMQCNLEKNNKCHKRKVKDGYSPLALAILDGVDDTVIAFFVSAVMLDTDVHSPFLCFKEAEKWTHPNHAANHAYIVRVYYYANVRLFFFLSTQVVFQ